MSNSPNEQIYIYQLTYKETCSDHNNKNGITQRRHYRVALTIRQNECVFCSSIYPPLDKHINLATIVRTD